MAGVGEPECLVNRSQNLGCAATTVSRALLSLGRRRGVRTIFGVEILYCFLVSLLEWPRRRSDVYVGVVRVFFVNIGAIMGDELESDGSRMNRLVALWTSRG